MKSPLMIALAGSALVFALTGCATTPTVGSAPATSSAPAAVASGDATVATASVGQVVVDGKGMTVYMFDKDTANSGASACTGGCAALWPAVIASSATPSVTGVSGTIGTISATKQLTINGLPVYTYAKDSAAGDVNGQGVGGIWWAVSPSGAKITATSTPTSTGSSY